MRLAWPGARFLGLCAVPDMGGICGVATAWRVAILLARVGSQCDKTIVTATTSR